MNEAKPRAANPGAVGGGIKLGSAVVPLKIFDVPTSAPTTLLASA
jgi:hypothetical protein